MAQLVAPAPGSERISQILPTVKCSTCHQPVRISELGDHVCAPLPPVPQLPAFKPPQSPRSVAALLPTKLQNLVNTPPSLQSPPRSSSISQSPARQKSPAPRQKSPAPPSTPRARVLSSASSLSTRSSDSRPDRVRSPPARSTGRPSFDQVSYPSSPRPSLTGARGPPSTPALPPDPFAASPIAIERSTTPGRAHNIPNPGPTALRARAPSNASMRQPTFSNAPPMPIDPRTVPMSGPMSPPNARQRAPTNVSMRSPPDMAQDVIYSTDMRARTPANDPVRMRAPSAASIHPFMDQARPSMDHQMRRPMDQMRRPSTDSQRPPFTGGPLPPARTPPPRATPTPAPEPDTKTGGEAGMAGVGRRGFAAVARVALFTSQMGPPTTDPMQPNQGMDGRRANAPRLLDIASATRYPTTPPLSPGSGTASLSPHSPYSQKSPVLGRPQGEPTSLNSRMMSPNLTPTTPAAAIASSPTSPILRDRVVSPHQEPSKVPPAEAPPTPRLPFFEKFKNKLPTLDTEKTQNSVVPSPASPTGSDDSYGGLAYANSDDDDEPLDIPLRASPQPLISPAPAAESKVLPPAPPAKEPRVRFPSMTESRYSSSSSSTAQSPVMPLRTLSSSTAASSYTQRTVSKSTGALDRAMETLLEDSTASSTSSSSPRVLVESSRERERDSVTKSPKFPMRSHTSPTLPSNRLAHDHRADVNGKARSASTSKRPRTKTCVRCEKQIEDGRWIQVEGGRVLCDKCWKNMYLPKCRRCNKTIEKQAVSSSDGQLKGKWHRECFSCFTCQKPFPDRSFYVHDGKPYCAYHYHEENNSLCAAARCGQPIEGPCAVSHAGDRYHPEHFLCEYRGCKERLVEYYELDGRMLCERHVQKAMREQDEDDEDYDDAYDAFGAAGNRNTMAMKRVTRFIDLDALGKTL